MNGTGERARAPRAAWFLIAFAAGILLWSFGRLLLTQTEKPAAPPTIALVIWDSVALDRLEPWGYEHATTPHLSRLATEGVVFEQHVPSSDGTNAALCSILTGRLPREHGVGRLDAVRGAMCPEGIATLAEELRLEGFRTLASFALPQLAPRLSGLGRGFELCAAPRLDPLEVERSGRKTLEAIRPALEQLLATREPVLIVLHLADLRARKLDQASGAERWLGERMAPFAKSIPEVEEALDILDEAPAKAMEQLSEQLMRRRGDPARAAYVSALYDAGVTAMDDVLGELLSTLERHGRRRDAVVAVCGARGGEMAMDYDPSYRGEPAARGTAPLLLRLPGGGWSGRSAAITQDVDLLPTLLSAAGVRSKEELEGFDLTARILGVEDGRPPRGAAFVEDARFERRWAVGSVWAQLSSLEHVLVFPRPGVTLGPEDDWLTEETPPPQFGEQLDQLSAVLDRHPPMGRLRVAGFDQAATRARVRGTLLAAVESGGLASTSQSIELADSGGAQTPWVELRAQHGAPDLSIEFASEDGLDEARVHIGDARLSELDLCLLPDPRAPEWPDEEGGETLPARCLIERESGGWSQVAVGLEPGREARVVVELFPASLELIADAIEADAGVRRSPHPRRPGAVVLEGSSPLLFRVRKRPSNEPAFAFFLDGERVPAAGIRRDGRRFAAPGSLTLCLSAAAWSDRELYTLPAEGDAPSAFAGVRIELLDPPPPGPVHAPPRELLDTIRSLANTD